MELVELLTNVHPAEVAAVRKPASKNATELFPPPLEKLKLISEEPDLARTCKAAGGFSNVVGLPFPSFTPTPVKYTVICGCDPVKIPFGAAKNPVPFSDQMG